MSVTLSVYLSPKPLRQYVCWSIKTTIPHHQHPIPHYHPYHQTSTSTFSLILITILTNTITVILCSIFRVFIFWFRNFSDCFFTRKLHNTEQVLSSSCYLWRDPSRLRGERIWWQRGWTGGKVSTKLLSTDKIFKYIIILMHLKITLNGEAFFLRLLVFGRLLPFLSKYFIYETLCNVWS